MDKEVERQRADESALNLSFLAQVWRGFAAFPQGVLWLRRHPRWMVALFLPGVAGVVLFVVVLGLVVDAGGAEAVMGPLGIVPWWRALGWWLGWGVVWLGLFAASLLAAVAGVALLASPLFEALSVAVEKEVGAGHMPNPRRSGFTGWLLASLEEMKKFLLMVFVIVPLLFVPGLNVLVVFVSAVFFGWSVYDLPMARQGWPLRERIRLARSDAGAIFGFGLWLVIPFLGLVLAPLAVVGGTMLGVEGIKRHVSGLHKAI